MLEINTIILAATFIITVAGSVWTLRGWMSNQFARIFSKVESTRDQILDKLEYHERHDDTRFSQISNDLWMVRLRLAARDGLTDLELKKEMLEHQKDKTFN